MRNVTVVVLVGALAAGCDLGWASYPADAGPDALVGPFEYDAAPVDAEPPPPDAEPPPPDAEPPPCGMFTADADTIALYHLDEGAGTAAADASGNGLDGVLAGATTWATGRFGGAVQFSEAVYDAIVVTGSVDWGTSFTVEAWIYSTDGNGYGELFSTNVSVVTVWLFPGATMRIRGPSYGPYTDSPGAPITPGEWHYVAGTYDGTSLRIYLDGALIGATTTAEPLDVPTSWEHRLGDHWDPPNNHQFDGLVDEVRLSSVTRSEMEIAAAYQAATACTP